MNVKEIKEKIKNSSTLRFSVSDGLHIKPNKDKKSRSWELRYTINNKRHFMTLKGSSFPGKSLFDARIEAALIKQKIKNGIDPLAERARQSESDIITINELFNDFYSIKLQKLDNPKILLRIFNQNIKPTIVKLKIDDVNARDIRSIITKVNEDGRPSIFNKSLLLCKQLFDHYSYLHFALFHLFEYGPKHR